MVLQIEIKRIDPDIVILELVGKVALGRESQQIERTVQDLLALNSKKVILDLTGVTYIDSAGIGVVAFSSGQVRKAGGEVLVAGASGAVLDSLKLTGIDTIVPFHPTVAAACESFGGNVAAAG